MNDHERARERKRANSCGLVNPCRIRQSEGRELRCDRTRQGTNRCENTFPGSEVATTQPCFRCVSSSIVSMMSGPEIPTGVHPVILPRAQCTIHRLPPWLDIVCEMPTEQRISLGPEKHPFTLCYRYEAVGNSIENSLCFPAKFQARVSSLPRSLNFYILGSPGQACWFNKGSQTWFQERLWRKIDARGRDQRRQTSYARLRGYTHFRIFLTS